MDKDYLSDEIGGILTLLVIFLGISWTVFLVLLNLLFDGKPRFLGNYLCNIIVSYFLWVFGIFVLISFSQRIYDWLNKRAKKRQEEGLQ